MIMMAWRGMAFGVTIAVASLTGGVPQAAWHGDDIDALSAALLLPEMVDVMQEEGRSFGTQIGADMLGDRAGARWEKLVAGIYDADWLYARVIDTLSAELSADEAQEITAFFTTEPGLTIVGLELSARRAMLDEAIDEMAIEAAALAAADETPRFKQLESYVEANDLVEQNVVGALNSNYAFFIGLLNGGAFAGGMSEDQILQDVWAQEPEIRDSTEEWIYSFLNLAYQPLSDAELETYIAFSETETGRAFNAALFAAFDPLFEEISMRLGYGAAQMMQSSDL